MKRLRGRPVRWICVVVASTLALISMIANSVQTVQDKQKVAKMTAKMKTVCVGRFLIDLPADAPVTLSVGGIRALDIWTVENESAAEFAERLREKEAALTEAVDLEGAHTLESAEPFPDDGAGKLYLYNRHQTKIREGARTEISEDIDMFTMFRLDEISVTAQVEWMAPYRIARMKDILRRLRPLAAGEIPHESGLCVGHAIVRDPYEHDNREGVRMLAGVPGHPDVNIAFSTRSGDDAAPGLIERNARAAARFPVYAQLAFSTLREGRRTIHEIAGEELVLRAREPNFTTGYAFQWETPSAGTTVHKPLLKLELDAGVNPDRGGEPVQSTLSEAALFELWESIVSTIRLRPTTPTVSGTTGAPTVALGTSALAGERCPQTGWWQCADGGHGFAVHGGERQFLKQGERMPQALLLPRATAWQRFRGLQPSFENGNPTLWSLADKRSRARVPSEAGFEQAIVGAHAGFNPAGPVPLAYAEAPIGSVAETGAACPASGWWRCEDSHALDGTRWFAAGSLLPAATFRTPMRSARRDLPERRRSAWRLVRIVADPGAPS